MSIDRLQSVANKGPAEPPKRHPAAETNSGVEGTYWSMGQTSEEVARRFGVSREEQDRLALMSQQRALSSRPLLAEEILPVNGVTADEGVRETTLEGLQKLKPAFGGFSTAGNSSQVTDGAAAVLMMTEHRARELGLKPLGRLVAYDSVGVDPKVMGIGPAVAIPRALAKAGLRAADIDVWEINEAFASQYGYTLRQLGVAPDKVNVQGGAMALGHPLGASGARLALSALLQLARLPNSDRRPRYAVVSMCVGGGFGSAAVFRKG